MRQICERPVTSSRSEEVVQLIIVGWLGQNFRQEIRQSYYRNDPVKYDLEIMVNEILYKINWNDFGCEKNSEWNSICRFSSDLITFTLILRNVLFTAQKCSINSPFNRHHNMTTRDLSVWNILDFFPPRDHAWSLFIVILYTCTYSTVKTTNIHTVYKVFLQVERKMY